MFERIGVLCLCFFHSGDCVSCSTEAEFAEAIRVSQDAITFNVSGIASTVDIAISSDEPIVQMITAASITQSAQIPIIQSGFSSMLNRIGGEESLRERMSAITEKYGVLKEMLTFQGIASTGYGKLAGGLLMVLGSAAEKRMNPTHGFVDESIAYAAMGKVEPAAIVESVEGDFESVLALFTFQPADGTYIRPCPPQYAIEYQERGQIFNSRIASRAECVQYMAAFLVMPTAKAPRRKRYEDRPVAACEHPDLSGWFRLLKLGQSREQVAARMRRAGHDPVLLDVPQGTILVRTVLGGDYVTTSDWDYYQLD